MSAEEALTWIREFRDLRETVERSILRVGTSVDGRRFRYQASLHGLDLEAGGYVTIGSGDETRLGQLLSLEMGTLTVAVPGPIGQITVRAAQGDGALLGGDGRPFHDAPVRPATTAEVGAWHDHSRPSSARMNVGELALAPGVPFELDARGFGRHTFLCGQSGSGKTYSLGVLLERLLARLVLRAKNLGVHRFGVWSRDEDISVLDDVVDGDIRCLVADLGSLGDSAERTLVAGAVLERLWSRRAERQATAIVIDEAHNVCPAAPEDELTALATEDAIRIAGEGRKFGLYLIVVTQRPQKVHENVLSQCDNLVLMRMNSLADLAHVSEVFSFVPPGLIERAATFELGEALVAGKAASHPALIRFGARITAEGGSDVAGWA